MGGSCSGSPRLFCSRSSKKSGPASIDPLNETWNCPKVRLQFGARGGLGVAAVRPCSPFSPPCRSGSRDVCPLYERAAWRKPQARGPVQGGPVDAELLLPACSASSLDHRL